MRDPGTVDPTPFPQNDLVKFNHWLWLTRLRSIIALLVLAVLLRWLVAPQIAVTPIAGIAGADVVVSLAYRRWLRTRRALRLLAYVQVTVDVVAIGAALSCVEQAPPVLFHMLFLLTIVPANMVDWQCGTGIAALASVGHFLLLWKSGTAGMISIDGLFPPAAFFLVGNQSLFYARHLAEKNTELATAAEALNQLNQRLGDEGVITAALLRAAQALTTSLDPEEILERLNDVVRSALRCEWSVTFLYDSQRNVYRVAGVSGTQPELIEDMRTFAFPDDSTAFFREAQRLGLVMVEERNSPFVSPALMERWHVSSFLCANLQHAGTSIGLLGAGFTERTGPFSAREVRLFRSIAQQSAIALENARLVENLRSASRLKSEFIGSMSHELRSPLNVVIGYVDLLLDDAMGPISGEQRMALERVQQNALQLLELIQETLDINRFEAGHLPLDIESFSVKEFMNQLREDISPQWRKPEVSVTWQVEPASARLRSDRGKLRKVLRNLIHNALKFTDRGSVTVAACATNGWVDFTVSDTGIGMSADAIHCIFDMFRQIDGSNTRRHGGVGLGLYIVKQLVRRLGGEITVNSTIGAGSTFNVRLRGGE